MYNWRKVKGDALPVNYYHDFNNITDATRFAMLLQYSDTCGASIEEQDKGYRVYFTPPQFLLEDFRYEGDGINMVLEIPQTMTVEQAESLHHWFVKVGISSEINYMLPANNDTHDCSIWIDNGYHGNDFAVTAYTLTEHD